MGDAKAGLLAGLSLGLQGAFSAMMAAFGTLFVAALWVLIRGGLAARKQSLPFGPFLAFGVILGFFFA
jgi:prepilin signal peptidase PulO-like enzyme (type II secretory pathway)